MRWQGICRRWFRAWLAGPFVAGIVASSAASAQTITTVAGTGVGGYNGDNIPAIAATLNRPHSVAVDADGTLFIADMGNTSIRRVDAVTGVITTVAYAFFRGGLAVHSDGSVYFGTHECIVRLDPVAGAVTRVAGTDTIFGGYNGDNIPATTARLNGPEGLALDAAGNLFIADRDNHRVRRVDAVTGLITTVAGNGARGYNGDNILATDAWLNGPEYIALDAAGNLFIADRDNHRVRRVDASTGLITTVAGNGDYWSDGRENIIATTARVRSPRGLAFDAAGNLFIGLDMAVRRVDAMTQLITTVVGDGGHWEYNGDNIPATSARLQLPEGLAFDAAGNLFIADSGHFHHRVRRVTEIGANPAVDSDRDGIPDATDNCPLTANPDQLDTDGDGTGNACDPNPNDGPTGDLDGDGVQNASDLCPNTPLGRTVDLQGCPLRNPIVIIPGILGTYLKNAGTGELIWVDPLRVLFDVEDSFLRDLMLDSDGVTGAIAIESGPVLDGSLGIPGSKTDYYGQLITALRQAGYQDNVTLFTFPYDWRLDNTEAHAHLLDALIESAIALSGGLKVDVVAHSMGGLVLRRYASLFGDGRLNKVIYVGTPHAGAPKAFNALAFEDPLSNNFLRVEHLDSQTLSAVSTTFPSVFQLMPRFEFITSGFDDTLLGLSASYTARPFGFLRSDIWVARANTFHELIQTPLSVPQFNIIGSGLPTLGGLRVFGGPLDTYRLWLPISANGDGTVPTRSVASGFATNFYVNSAPAAGAAHGIRHDSLPNDSTIITLIQQVLADDLDVLPGGVSTTEFPFEGVVEWFSASPIRVTATDASSNKTGLGPDGSVRDEIPGSSLFLFEQNEGGFLLPGQTYRIDVTAIASGVFSLTFNEKNTAGVLTRATAFTDIPIAENSIGSLLLAPDDPAPALSLDIDGNGATDFIIRANQPLTPASSLQMLTTVIRSFRLNRGIENSLTAKADAASRAVTRGNTTTANNLLSALLNEILAQTGRQLTPSQAGGLTNIINKIMSSL